ncbi:succinyldiaminopimelate desuccinylase [Paramicrobacterium humi]|uniref:Succinyl-diaminopimelate desuccinylase n=1 Tax=Paramicrobacterium humi TaxID=640635 RepID=A0A1H4T6U5_9MICO|nr:succinyl-diaminopimelate desuccinylase [Microbacterium humi]SEC52029.1 succinyldiaminopimelate desuccinylase [Microbacterium humi]
MPAPELDLTASVVDIARQLCDIPSESGDEKAIADAVERAVRGREHLEVIRDGDTVIARTLLGRDKRVVIAGHLDTVPINDNVPSRFETIEGREYLWGRGSVDMKAGVAVQLKLAAELDAPLTDVTWIWYDHEEVSAELNSLGRIADARPELLAGDFAILGEPTAAVVEGGCNGSIRFEVRAFGTRAHSARSWVGDNAIHKLSSVLDTLAGYEPATVEVEGLEYREGLNAVGISGGVAGNVIPDEAMVHVNYRFAPDKSSEQAVVRMQELFADFDVTIVDRSEPARPGLDAPLAQDFLRAVGGEAKPKYGWTDVARFSALGMPAVNYGPGDALKAHADDERCATDEIIACERGLRRWLVGE